MKIKNLFKLVLIAIRGRVGSDRRAYEEHKTVLEVLRKHAERSGSWAEHSRAALTRMEVGDFPQKYLETGLSIGDDGNLVVRVCNPTTVALEQIRLRITYHTPDSRKKSRYQPLGRILDCGQSVRIKMDIGPIASNAELERFAVEAVNAHPVN